MSVVIALKTDLGNGVCSIAKELLKVLDVLTTAVRM